MQKIINVLAVLSFVGVSGIVGTGAAVYLNREALAEQAKERITKAATEAIAGALPGMLDSAMPEMPEMPKETGNVIPF
jgi:zinc transporter ZupT